MKLELHHLDCRGVPDHDGSWRAFERHADLVPIRPYCPELLHRLIGCDRALANRSRRAAPLQALARLRVALNVRGIA